MIVRIATLLSLASLAASSVQALESNLASAAALPELSEESAERLAYFKATNTATTFFARLASDAFREECEKREATLRSLPEDRVEGLSSLTRALLNEGFDAFDLVSKRPTPRIERTLSRSVCVVLSAKTRHARSHKATLVTTSLSDVRTSAVALGLAKLLQGFRLEGKPIWVCTLTEEEQPHSGAPAVRELLHSGKDRRPFASHIALTGTQANAFVNFLGRETTRFEFAQPRWHWIERDGDTALEAARFVRDELVRSVDKQGAWARSKKSPWLKTTIGPIRCENSLITSGRNVCRFDVSSISRSRGALSEKTLSLVHTALSQTDRFNAILKAPKKEPVVRLSLPKNTARHAIAGSLENNEVLKAWRTSLGKNPPADVYLSTRFIASETAATSALARIPTLVLSGRGKNDAETRKHLERLAETLLILSGVCDEPPTANR